MATYTYKHYTYNKSNPCATWYMEITETEVNQSNNTSKININFYVKATHNKTRSDTYNNYPAGYGSSTPYSKIYINGSCVKTKNPACFDCRYNSKKKVAHGTTYSLGSYSKVVTHNSDGNLSLTIKCQHYTSVSPGYVTLEKSFTCTKINVHRQTYLTVPGGTHNIGSNITIQANPKSTSYTHALNVSLTNNPDNKTGWVNIANGIKFGSANKNNNYSFKIPNEFKNSIGKQKTATMYVKLSTWINGSYIGVETKTTTIKNNDQPLRKSYLTVPGGLHNIGSTMTVQINPCSTSLKHILWLSLDNKNWIKIKDGFTLGSKDTNNSVSFTIPDSYKNNVPAKSEYTMYVWLDTYNGSSHLGYENKTVKIYNNYDKTSGSFNFSSKMQKTDGKYLFSKNKKIITDLNITWDYMPYGVTYEITGPSGYSYTKDYSVNYERGSADNSGDWYILWKDKPQGSGYHQYTSPTLPKPGTYKIKVTVKDGRALSSEMGYFTKTITISLEEPSEVRIDSLAIDNGFTYVSNGKYIIDKSDPKVDVTFYTDLKISKIVFDLTGANKASKSLGSNEIKSILTGKSNKVSMKMGTLTKAGSNKITVTVTATTGKVVTKSISFQSYEPEKYLSIKDSYIDNSVAKNLVKSSFFVNHSRLGLRIMLKHSHKIKYLKLTIGSKQYDITSYAYNNAAYTCPDTLTTYGDNKIILSVKDENGLTDTKTFTLFVDKEVTPPGIPIIRFEHKTPRRPHRHFYFCEGEHVIFTGTSSDIKDYQIIYALAPCDVFKAFENYNSKNCYADVDSDELSDRLEANTSDDIRYFIYKDFGEGEDARPICKHPSKKYTFRLYDVAPDHDAHEEFFALQWFEHAEPGDVLFLYVRERKEKKVAASATTEYFYSDSYSYNNIPKSKMFPMCVLPPLPSQIQLYEKFRDDNKIVVEYTNPIFDLDLGAKNPIHLIDVCLIAKDKSGKVLDGNENKKRDGKHGRSWVYYSDRQWHNMVPWKYSQENNKEKFEMEFDISKYGKDPIIYVVAFYYSDFYRHPSIYSTSNILQSKSQDMKFNLSFLKPVNNSKVITPNPVINLQLTPEKTEDNTTASDIYSDIDFAKHWHKYKPHWHKCPIWLHHWPRPHDRCFPHFREHEWCRHNSHYHEFDGCPHHRIEHHHHHKHFYHSHHPCWKIPDKLDINNTVSYDECCLFLRCGDREVNLGDVNIDELTNESKIYTWTEESGKTFLKPGKNTISAYSCPYEYSTEETETEVEIENGRWHTRSCFICHPIMPHHPHHFLNVILRPSHIHNWLDIERHLITFKIPYKKLKPGKEYVLTFKSFVDRGFDYDPYKRFEVPYKRYEDDDLICGAFMDIDIKHNNELINLDYEKRHIIFRPQYHILDHGILRPCINRYKKEVLHTIKFTAPAQTNNDRFFTISIKARGVHKIKIFSCKMHQVKQKEEDLIVTKQLNKSVKNNETSINVTYEFNFDAKDLRYINPMLKKDQTYLRNFLLTASSACGLDNIKPGWRNYDSTSYLMARDFNDMKNYCYNLFTGIKNLFPNTFEGKPEKFKTLLPTITTGTGRGPKDFSNRGKHYFYEWDDLIDIIKSMQFGEYTPPKEPEIIKCTGINIKRDRIPVPQSGKIGDTYPVEYEVFPSNCMEEVVWSMESTEFVNVDDAVMKRTVKDIDLTKNMTTTTTKKETTTSVKMIQGYYDSGGTVRYNDSCAVTEKFNLYEMLQSSEKVTIEFYRARPTDNRGNYLAPNRMEFYRTLTSGASLYPGRFGEDDFSSLRKYAEIQVSEPGTRGRVLFTFKKSNSTLMNALKNYPYVSIEFVGSDYNMGNGFKIHYTDFDPVYAVYQATTSTTTIKEKSTKVIAKCGSYSDSAVVFVEPGDMDPNFKIEVFAIDYKNALGLSKALSIDANNSVHIRVVVGKSYFTLAKMVIKITGKNSQTITTTKFKDQTFDDVYASMLKEGTDNWTVEVYDTKGNIATATVTTNTIVYSNYEPPAASEPEEYPCTGLSLSPSSISVFVGGTGYIYGTYSPSNCTDKVTVSSSNSNISAIVTNTSGGKITIRITGYDTGTGTLTAKCGNYTDTASITMMRKTVKCNKVWIDGGERTFSCSNKMGTGGVGGSYLTFKTDPSNADEDCSVSSSNPSVCSATYNPARYTREIELDGYKPGTATITLRYGNCTTSVTVTVTK